MHMLLRVKTALALGDHVLPFYLLVGFGCGCYSRNLVGTNHNGAILQTVVCETNLAVHRSKLTC